MRYVTILLACLLECSLTAQDQPDDSVVYIVELDDEMIEKLKLGMTMQETVPPSIRDKIDIVRVRYKPSGLGNTGESPITTGPEPADQSAASILRNNKSPNGIGRDAARESQSNRIDSVVNPSADQSREKKTFGTPSGQTTRGLQQPSPSSSGGQWSPPGGSGAPSLLDLELQKGAAKGGLKFDRSGNAFAPISHPTESQFRQDPSNSNPPSEPPANEFDTRNRPISQYQHALQGQRSSPQTHESASGQLPTDRATSNQAHSAFDQVSGASFGKPLPGNQLAVPGYRPDESDGPSSKTRFGMPRQSHSVAGYHKPDTRRQEKTPPIKRDGYSKDSLVNNDLGSSAGGFDPSPQLESGPAAANTDDSKNARVKRLLYFMLFCSVGLNLYLGWISRGFYVRYRELADELRESFSAAM